MNCSNDMSPLGPIECRETRPLRASLGWILHLICMMSKDMPRKKKKAYRKKELKSLQNEIIDRMHAGDI